MTAFGLILLGLAFACVGLIVAILHGEMVMWRGIAEGRGRLIEWYRGQRGESEKAMGANQ